MIKDTRYIIKRVIIGVLICLILSFIRTCEVKALNAIQSVSLNYSGNNQNSSYDIFTSTNTLKNMGRGYLQFSYSIYDWKENATHYTSSLSEVRVESGNNIYTCNIGTISTSVENDDQYLSNVYSVLCPVNLGSSGLTKIHIETTNTGTGTSKSSQFMTFVSDLDNDNGAKLDTINSTLATYLQSVYNATYQTQVNTGASNNYLSAIQVLLNTDLSQIISLLSSNTQAIIDNQDQNTQEQIESQQVCKTTIIDKNDIKDNNNYLNSSGNLVSSNNRGVTDYIDISYAEKISVLQEYSTNGEYACFYNSNKEKITCVSLPNITVGTDLIIPSGAKYFRSTIVISINKPQFEIEICKNGNQANNDAINDVNDTLNDSSVDDPNSSLTEMDNKIATNSVISDLLLLPVTLFQNILNSINGTCSNFNLGSLFGTNLTMPCIDIEGVIGSTLWGVIDVLLSGIFVLSIRKKFVDIFENITSLKDGGNQLE